LLENQTVPEHKLGVFECSVSDSTASVEWYVNNEPITKLNKSKYQVLSIGVFRRLAIRNCLLPETDSLVTCKYHSLKTEAKLTVIGTFK
jgi:hypothetical protein